jgi:hypothetical protein
VHDLLDADVAAVPQVSLVFEDPMWLEFLSLGVSWQPVWQALLGPGSSFVQGGWLGMLGSCDAHYLFTVMNVSLLCATNPVHEQHSCYVNVFTPQVATHMLCTVTASPPPTPVASAQRQVGAGAHTVCLNVLLACEYCAAIH